MRNYLNTNKRMIRWSAIYTSHKQRHHQARVPVPVGPRRPWIPSRWTSSTWWVATPPLPWRSWRTRPLQDWTHSCLWINGMHSGPTTVVVDLFLAREISCVFTLWYIWCFMWEWILCYLVRFVLANKTGIWAMWPISDTNKCKVTTNNWQINTYFTMVCTGVSKYPK